MKRTFAILLLVLSIATHAIIPAVAQEGLSLEEYLRQVESLNPEIKSINSSMSALDLKLRELDMAYSPYLTASASYLDDRSGLGFGSTLPADSMTNTALSLGLNKKWISGTTLSAGFSDTTTALKLMTPTAVVGSELLSEFTGYEVKPFVRVDQSLLKDTQDGVTRSGIRKARSGSRSGQYMRQLGKQQIRTRAIVAYWTLALTREVVGFRKTSLVRAEQLQAWNEKRVGLDLADKGDLLQAQAAVRLRKLNLQMAQEDELRAAIEFNELRGAGTDRVTEELETIAKADVRYAARRTLEKAGERADVLAARETHEAGRYALREATLRSGPELSVFGSASLKGLTFDHFDSFKQVAGAEHPSIMIGLAYSTPLDPGLRKDVRTAYEREIESSRETLSKVELNARNDWQEINRTWKNVHSRLLLAKEVKDLQNKRLEHEQVRFERGRTTTFQLITAENDLDDATLNEYRLILEKLATMAQVELYNTRPLR